MANLDLGSLISDAVNFNQEAQAGASQVSVNAASQVDLSKQNADLYSTIGDSQALVEATKQNAALVTQQAKIAAANKLGTNLKVQSDYRDSLTNLILNEGANQDAALSKVQQLKSVSLFDDPVQWVMNQVELPDAEDAANASTARLQAAQQRMMALNQITQTQNRTAGELDESLTAASIKASVDDIKAKAQLQANNEAIKALQYNTQGIQAAAAMSREGLQAMFSAESAQIQKQQLGIAMQHLALSQQEFDWRKEEKERGKQTEQYLIDTINTGGQALLGTSYVPIEPGSAKANSLISMMKGGQPLDGQLKAFYEAGSMTTRSGTSMLSATPAGAVDILRTVPVQLPAAQQPVAKVLEQATHDTQLAAQGQFIGPDGKLVQIDPKNRQALQEFLNQRAQALITQQSKEIKPGDSTNVFQIGSIKSLIQLPAVSQEPVVQKVIAPAIAAGADLSDPDKLFSTVNQALADKKISYNEALGITTLYSAGENLALESRVLTKFGLKPEFSYNARITTGTGGQFFGKTQVVDLTKPDAVGRAFMKSQAGLLSRDIGNTITESASPLGIAAGLPR